MAACALSPPPLGHQEDELLHYQTPPQDEDSPIHMACMDDIDRPHSLSPATVCMGGWVGGWTMGG